MPEITSEKIRKLLFENEGPKLDFKQRLSLTTELDKIEFAKDICAIANTGKGNGYILVGIEDKTKRVLGICPTSISEERLQQIVSSHTDPPPKFSVEFIQFKGKDLAVICISGRSLGILHQVTRIGFPIRRGSTTGTMATNEIRTLVQTHARRTRSKASEYALFSSFERTRAMRRDTTKALLELGFENRETKEIQEANKIFVLTNKTIKRRKFKLYFHFCSENADKSYIEELQYLVDLVMGKGPKSRAIFVSIVHGSISIAFLKSIVQSFGSLTSVPISPSIFYFGVGSGITLSHHDSIYGQPRFYAYKVKSKEDIKARIQVILGWIEQNEGLFSQIYDSFHN